MEEDSRGDEDVNVNKKQVPRSAGRMKIARRFNGGKGIGGIPSPRRGRLSRLPESTRHQALELFNPTREWLYARRRKLATVGIGVLAAWMGWHVIFGANGMLTYEHKRTEYHNLQSEIENLEKENDHMQSDIKALRSDPKTIEREAREQLRYARPGEKVFTYPQPTVQQPPANATAKRQ